MPRRPGVRPASSPVVMPIVHLARDVPAHVVAANLTGATWRKVGRGTYVPSSAPEAQRADALARIVGIDRRLEGDHDVSHASAALVHGLPLWHVEPVTHLYQPSSASSRHQRDIVRHTPMPDEPDVDVVNGIPVTSLERTVWDCVTTMRPLASLVLADGALRAGLDQAALVARAAESPGRRGVARGRTIAALADTGAESAYETACRFLLLRDGFPAPQTQVAVETRLGTYWADLGWPQWRVVIEYDGRSKYLDAEVLMREKRRHDAILEAGWRIVRVTRDDLRESFSLVERVTPLLPTLRLIPRRELVW